jgi:hypothetical protein
LFLISLALHGQMLPCCSLPVVCLTGARSQPQRPSQPPASHSCCKWRSHRHCGAAAQGWRRSQCGWWMRCSLRGPLTDCPWRHVGWLLALGILRQAMRNCTQSMLCHVTLRSSHFCSGSCIAAAEVLVCISISQVAAIQCTHTPHMPVALPHPRSMHPDTRSCL